MKPWNPNIQVQAEPFDAAHDSQLLTAGRNDVGALVTFTGLCRDEGGRLAALELEHYPGMAEAEMLAAMEPFSQADPSLSRGQEGFGLGLPLTRHLVELHGGTVTLSSRQGEGTTVWVTFPSERIIADDEATEVEAEEEEEGRREVR